jgi:hypothetical protein
MLGAASNGVLSKRDGGGILNPCVRLRASARLWLNVERAKPALDQALISVGVHRPQQY